MLFDTHCHLNFKAFDTSLLTVIDSAKKAGVQNIVIPGTDVETSQKAVTIVKTTSGLYAAVGIHPHHVYELKSKSPAFAIASAGQAKLRIEEELEKLETLLVEKKTVAVGEVGVDRYEYTSTKYQNYAVDEEFVAMQKSLLTNQIQLAIKHGKSLILHNRKAVDDLLNILTKSWDQKLRGRTVFHCCEADERLLTVALDKGIYIGVDGDITWSKKKQRFIATVPLERLALETDSPYLTPEEARVKQVFPNEPKNITYVRDVVARIHNVDASEVEKYTTENAMKLFNLT
ncbi:MAG: TatD family hydrolase [Candidatus Roizmanbacteria bacterium]|nr:TatD family hydrolase [Candidatus Roizmanbacteria bacterium]